MKDEFLVWLKQYKYSQYWIDLVQRHKFSDEELKFMRSHLKLVLKKEYAEKENLKWS